MMKNLDNILERYFEGETSLEEEKMLRTYFQQNDIGEKYKSYAPMFRFFAEEQSGANNRTVEKKSRKTVYRLWISVAASIILLIGDWSIFTIDDNSMSQSLVYINGKRISDKQVVNDQALTSLQNIAEMDEEILSDQIAILELFTD